MVAFIPGFHPCGTLNIFALDERSLEYSDFDLLPRSNETIPKEEGQEVAKTLRDYYEEAKDSVMEEAALEGTVLSWARGWRNTCGKGAVNKQVKIVKISADGMKAGASRKDWVKALGKSGVRLSTLLASILSPRNSPYRRSYRSSPRESGTCSSQQPGHRDSHFPLNSATPLRRRDSLSTFSRQALRPRQHQSPSRLVTTTRTTWTVIANRSEVDRFDDYDGFLRWIVLCW